MYQDNITDINEFLVRDALRELGETTRSELSERLGLSPASISRIVRRLVKAGIVSEHAGSEEGPGRKSDIIRFNARSACVLAVDLGGTKCHGAIADLAAETLAEDYRGTFSEEDPGETLLACIDALRAEAKSRDLEVRALVVGIPAVPDPDTGLVGEGPNVGWEEYDLIGLLREHVQEPFRIENDVTLAAIGQAWRGEGQAATGFVTLSLGTGIGGAIFANGQIVRGRQNSAGEIGYMLTSPDQLRAGPSAPALESVASGPAIAARAKHLLADGARSSLTGDPITAADVFEAAAAGDELAGRVIDELLDHVSIMVLNVAALLNPERIIFDGSVGRALEPYTAEMLGRVEGRLPHLPEVRYSRLGPNATVIGAIAGALVLERETDARRVLGELGDLPARSAPGLASVPAYGALDEDGTPSDGPDDQAA
jgi:glucokinase